MELPDSEKRYAIKQVGMLGYAQYGFREKAEAVSEFFPGDTKVVEVEHGFRVVPKEEQDE